jgi:hypothetical protein
MSPCTGLDRHRVIQEFEAPIISRQSAHEGGEFLSPTHRPPLPPGNIACTHFFWSLSRPRAIVRPIMSIKNSKETIGNRTRDLPTCSALPQQTACPNNNNNNNNNNKPLSVSVLLWKSETFSFAFVSSRIRKQRTVVTYTDKYYEHKNIKRPECTPYSLYHCMLMESHVIKITVCKYVTVQFMYE